MTTLQSVSPKVAQVVEALDHAGITLLPYDEEASVILGKETGTIEWLQFHKERRIEFRTGYQSKMIASVNDDSLTLTVFNFDLSTDFEDKPVEVIVSDTKALIEKMWNGLCD